MKHSVPWFQGEQSRDHVDIPVWKLGLQGGLYTLLPPRTFRRVKYFVQFMSFPRSGHSLIGSLLDAHPRAIISHELDTMGLIKKNLPERSIYGLIKKNSKEFTEHGRFWNGFSYTVPKQPHGHSDELRVIGDKKGDWAVRWCDKDPPLLSRLRTRFKATPRWLLVTRNPMDNIATLSLRKNRTYDKLRINIQSSENFKTELKRQQESGGISAEARDDMISDYGNLCSTISKMRENIPQNELLHIVYENFCFNPEKELARICDFLEIDTQADYLKDSASIVRPTLNKSRNRVIWTDRQLEQVTRIVKKHEFLQCYAPELELNG